MSNLPVIAGIEITTDGEGRFNLNALHKASGEGESKEPNKWLALKSAKELTKELEATEESFGSVVATSRGGTNPGTFAHELLAISYAGWISPKFQLQVNQVFIDYKTGRMQPQPQPMVKALDYVDRIMGAMPNLCERSKQQLFSDASEIDLGRRLIPLPSIQEEYWTATEIAKKFGISANKVGRVANGHGLKTDEFGEYRLSKSQNSAKQVEQFFYNKKGLAAIALALGVNKQVEN